MTTLAMMGGEPTRKTPYPEWPVHDQRDVDAVTAVVQSGRWGGFPYPGPQTAAFIRRFEAMQNGQGSSIGVAMMNGTITMEIALKAAGVGWGDEVLLPAYTFQATAYAPIAAGAIPVLVDVDPETYCIDPKAAEAAITGRTRAIIPVHLAAQMADMDAIMALAEKYNLIVIEDCAHAHGAAWRGYGAGTIGHFGSFSMQSSKILTGGEGGMLLCKTPELAYRAASLIDCGRPHDPDRQLNTFGGNYRMTELQAALLNVGLERFEDQARERAEMADYMDEALSEVRGVTLLRRDPRHTRRSFYRYVFKVNPDAFGGATNQIVCAALDAENIPCWHGYEPMNRNPLFQPGLSRMPVPSAFPERMVFPTMPECERAYTREAVWLDESIFRAGRQGVDDVIAALKKVQAWFEEHPEAVREISG